MLRTMSLANGGGGHQTTTSTLMNPFMWVDFFFAVLSC
jgi:hypothetical protein